MPAGIRCAHCATRGRSNINQIVRAAFRGRKVAWATEDFHGDDKGRA